VQDGGINHRLFCVLERDASDLGGSSIVVIDRRPVQAERSAGDPQDYRRASLFRDEFQRRSSVLS
jgi:hypothetical protein